MQNCPFLWYLYTFLVAGHSTDGHSPELLEDSQKLLERFKYPWEMMPLMYVILKNSEGDMEKASRLIDEGTAIVKNSNNDINFL